MPRRSILSATERDTLLALPESQDDLIRYYTFNDSDLSLNTGVRNSNQSISENGSPMSQVVAVGTYNNSATISANDEVKIRIQFAYIKPSLT